MFGLATGGASWRVRERGGPCERHLHTAVARSAPLLRAAVVGVSGAFGVSPSPVAFVVLVVAVVVPCAQSLARAPSWFLPVNGALAVVVGLSQVVLGAQPTSGWVFAAVSITTVTCYFEWPDRPVAAHALVGLAILAHSAGCLLAGAAVDPAAVWRLVVQAALAWFGLLLGVHAARLCDELVRRAEGQRVAAAAARAQRAADRAYRAMLHDTASTTLLMVSTDATGEFDWLAREARRDVEVLTAHTPAGDQDVDLGDLLGSLTTYPGLAVRVEVQPGLTVPARQAFAIYHGVREALSNVRRHSGDLAPSLSATERDGVVLVRVADRGRGYEPSAVGTHRHGVSGSIEDRMAAAGGRAEVRSAPGSGTTVEWTWSRA